DYREYFSKMHREPIGLYVYDGDHSYDNQLIGLQAAEPFFAKGCIILVDDTNWLEPRNATLDFISKSSYEYRILFDTTTCSNRHPTLWNGIMVLQRTNTRTKRRSRNTSTREPRGPMGLPPASEQASREADGSQIDGRLLVPYEQKGGTMAAPL